jgi:hypothetical protein
MRLPKACSTASIRRSRAAGLTLLLTASLPLPGAALAQGGYQHAAFAARAPARPALSTRAYAPRAVRLESPVVIVPLNTPGNRPIVTALINGHGPFLLGIETGSPAALLLFSHTLRALRLPPEPNLRRPQVIDSVRIGGLIMYEVPAYSPGDSPIPSQLDGMLGLAAYARLTMELDVPGGRALFAVDTLPEANGEDVLSLLGAGDIFAVPIHAGDRTLSLALDSQGGIGLAVRSALAEELPLASPFVQVGVLSGPAIGTVARRAARVSCKVMLGRYEFERPLLAADIIPEQFPADGIIGMHSLSAFSVALDQRTRRIRFTRFHPVIAAPGSLYGHGVVIAYGLEHLEVSSVLPDSPEADAALRSGDRIVEINGRSTAGFAPSDWEPLSESPAPLVLLIERGGKSTSVTLPARVLVR